MYAERSHRCQAFMWEMQEGRPNLLLQAAQLGISMLGSQLRSRSHDMEGPAAASPRFHR